MKIKQQLSLATVLMAGAFLTGCSGQQQIEGGSQVSGASQQQVEGGSQVAGASQQQVEEPVVAAPAPAPAPMAAPAPRRVAPVVVARPRTNRWTHTHPAIPRCTKSIRHTHKYNSARHSHKYGCNRPAPRRAAQAKQAVDVYALQRKLKAKGYYKGPIDGVVGPGTRSALKRFMNR